MFWLINTTIKRKLMLITMATTTVALVMAIAGFLTWGYFDEKANILSETDTHAAMIATNVQAALAFQDKQDAELILRGLKIDPSIVFACVYDKQNKLFAKYLRENIPKKFRPPENSENTHIFHNGFLSVFRDISVDSEKIGSVCLTTELTELRKALVWNSIIGLIIAVVVFVVACFQSSRLQAIVSGPILTLAESATKLGGGDLDHRVHVKSRDELGLLAGAFNDMAAKLKDSYEGLEKKVTERTAELTSSNKKLEKEVAQRTQAQEKQKQLFEEVKSANQELNDFAHIVSHDLKAPLYGIKTIADWISSDYKDKLDDDGKEQLGLLMNRVDRMYNLIDGILTYSRAGRTNEQREPVDLNELVHDIIDTLAVPENITVEVNDNLPVISCDQTRILQVFQNLLSNAVKYMDKPQGQIIVACSEENDFWKFSIADNGPGIEEKNFERIFKIFQTGAPRDEIDSTGVGLSVVKKIVEMYGGTIWVESQVDKGSTFIFTYPKQEAEQIYEESEAHAAY